MGGGGTVFLECLECVVWQERCVHRVGTLVGGHAMLFRLDDVWGVEEWHEAVSYLVHWKSYSGFAVAASGAPGEGPVDAFDSNKEVFSLGSLKCPWCGEVRG